jgi:pyruvate kinase
LEEQHADHVRVVGEQGCRWWRARTVRSPADIDLVHRAMDEVPGGRLPVIAKLEKPETVDNLEAIVLAFDGMMVARGDLGVECSTVPTRSCSPGRPASAGTRSSRW